MSYYSKAAKGLSDKLASIKELQQAEAAIHAKWCRVELQSKKD
jgi:hypothetical protein